MYVYVIRAICKPTGIIKPNEESKHTNPIRFQSLGKPEDYVQGTRDAAYVFPDDG